MHSGFTRLDLITARELSFEMICFLQGYAVGKEPYEEKIYLIESVKELREQWYGIQKARMSEVDRPEYYALLARLLPFIPMRTNGDSEGWAQRLSMFAHTKLFEYLERMCDIYIEQNVKALTLDLAVQEVTGDLTEKYNRAEHQVWHAYALTPGQKITLRIDRVDLKFSIAELEKAPEQST